MSVQASTDSAPPTTTPQKIIRRSANFHPNIWGDRFIAYTSDNLSIDASLEKQIEELKAGVRRKLVAASADKPSQKLKMIDEIQRLGLAYHFETEIKEALEHINCPYHDENNDDDDDLYHVALRFRLLRQQGSNVSCDMFNKFKDNKGNFKETLIGDVPSMLSLYEAAHLRVHGEDILDEALTFSATHLESMATQLSPPLATQVIRALKQPIRKGIPRLEARQYISIYLEDDSHDESLLKLAKLDFNQLQKIHQKELSEISKWWKDLDFASKLPFVRDRVVEDYFWILGVYFEHKYQLARRILTKVIAITSAIDDIYDVYGYSMPTTTSFVGMGDIVTKETFEWVLTEPNVVKASSIICRLMDDMVSHKFEQERGHVASGVECYMKQNGVSEQEVSEEFHKQVTNAWKDINQECLKPTAVPMPILMCVLNLARVIDALYKDEDGYTYKSWDHVERLCILIAH